MDEIDYEKAVALHYEHLYRFAFSLAGSPDEAAELTQEAYYRLLGKDVKLRDPSKVKSWLFTTLYRVFLGERRHSRRFPHVSLAAVEQELPTLSPEMVAGMDGEILMRVLMEIDEHHRVPLTLFYLEDLSYREIAELLEVPIGTVMSRLSRGKEVLRELLTVRAGSRSPAAVTPVDFRASAKST